MGGRTSIQADEGSERTGVQANEFKGANMRTSGRGRIVGE